MNKIQISHLEDEILFVLVLTGKLRKHLFRTNKKFVYLNITTNFCPKIKSENIVPRNDMERFKSILYSLTSNFFKGLSCSVLEVITWYYGQRQLFFVPISTFKLA